MKTMLEKEILKKCRKKILTSEQNEKEIDDEEEEEGEKEFEETEILEEELPLDDVLAEKRRKYTMSEEFVYLLYNDILPNFIAEWNGYYLRKKFIDLGKGSERKGEETVDQQSNENEHTEGDSIRMPWCLNFRDEYAQISFVSENTYSGRISRKMMEGEGVYKWHNGVQYKGEFERNQMQGKGLIEWSNGSWYEGEFVNGYRHGRGTMVDNDHRLMYIGEWSMGQRHGKGYCRYAENDSYDGDWITNIKEGVGFRIYSNGARYVGEWKNDVRHGTGTMAWPNGDVYRGEWQNGKMHGHGEYIWNGFFNKTLTWPQEASYVGEWQDGMRHGKGVLKLNSIGGAKYFGYWKQDRKHGYGIILGNNGEITEGDPLFLKDVLASPDVAEVASNKRQNGSPNVENKLIEDTEPEIYPYTEQLFKLPEARLTTVSKPEQFPSLWYYTCRLLEPDLIKEPSVYSIPSGRCYICQEDVCSCLIQYTEGKEKSVAEVLKNSENNIINVGEKISVQLSNLSLLKRRVNTTTEKELEERWIYNCIMMHMPQLREIYRKYAELFATRAPKCTLAMCKLSLWQLWRDCGIHKRLSLAEIDVFIGTNKSTVTEDPHYAFEKIEIWQFLHALLEVSWHLYTKYDDIETKEMQGRIAGGLYRFLKIDVYPNAGNHVGTSWRDYRDLLPIYAVFELYRQREYPLSARDLLKAMCMIKGKILIFYRKERLQKKLRNHLGMIQPQASSAIGLSYNTISDCLPDGVNCVTIGEKISYLPKEEESLTQSETFETNSYNDHEGTLLKFKELGAFSVLEIIARVCPLIKDTESDVIVNMDYKLTFLEFYEIILEATKRVLYRRKVAKEKVQTTEMETKSIDSRVHLQKEQLSKSTIRSPSQKSFKSKKKIVR